MSLIETSQLETFGPSADGHNMTGEFNPSFHGFQGPLGVSLPGFSQKIDQLVLESIGSHAFPFSEDPNSGNEKGFGE